MSIGQAVKAMVLNGLGFVNRALYLTPQFCADKPTALLIGAGPETGVIEIVPGYSRDHRPEFNQAVLNLVVEQRVGLPLLMEPLSGNSSDKVSFGELIERHIDGLACDVGVEYWVADSALYTETNLQTLSAHQGRWISRVPETISTAQIERDAMDAPTTYLAKGYHYRAVEAEYGGVHQRWLVITSAHAMKRAGPGIQRRVTRIGEKEGKAYQNLTAKRFACEADARQALSEFQAGLALLSIEEADVIRSDPHDKRVWQIVGHLASDSLIRWWWLWQKSTFIVATNELDAQRLSDQAVWQHYQQQQKAERGFRFLKDPRFQANTLFLKSPQRLMALTSGSTRSALASAQPGVAG